MVSGEITIYVSLWWFACNEVIVCDKYYNVNVLYISAYRIIPSHYALQLNLFVEVMY